MFYADSKLSTDRKHHIRTLARKVHELQFKVFGLFPPLDISSHNQTFIFTNDNFECFLLHTLPPLCTFSCQLLHCVQCFYDVLPPHLSLKASEFLQHCRTAQHKRLKKSCCIVDVKVEKTLSLHRLTISQTRPPYSEYVVFLHWKMI